MDLALSKLAGIHVEKKESNKKKKTNKKKKDSITQHKIYVQDHTDFTILEGKKKREYKN